MISAPLFDLKFLPEFAAGGVGTSNRRHQRRRSEGSTAAAAVDHKLRRRGISHKKTARV